MFGWSPRLEDFNYELEHQEGNSMNQVDTHRHTSVIDAKEDVQFTEHVHMLRMLQENDIESKHIIKQLSIGNDVA